MFEYRDALWNKKVFRFQRLLTAVLIVLELFRTLYVGLTDANALSVHIELLVVLLVVDIVVAFSTAMLSNLKNIKQIVLGCIFSITGVCSVAICAFTYMDNPLYQSLYILPILFTFGYAEDMYAYYTNMLVLSLIGVNTVIWSFTDDVTTMDNLVRVFLCLLIVEIPMFIFRAFRELNTKGQKYLEVQKNKELASIRERELDEHRELKEKLLHDLFVTITTMVDFNDTYTSGHSMRVGIYSKMIAERLNLSRSFCEEIFYAGLVHDVGKVAIDDKIINKKGKLTEEEYEILKTHTEYGYRILGLLEKYGCYADGALYHHERVDGTGYPRGVTDIPLVGKIISVADAYDAMTSHRSYRKALTQDIVKNELLKGKGTQFDSRVVDIMIQIIDEDIDFTLKQKDFDIDNIHHFYTTVDKDFSSEPVESSNVDETISALKSIEEELITTEVLNEVVVEELVSKETEVGDTPDTTTEMTTDVIKSEGAISKDTIDTVSNEGSVVNDTMTKMVELEEKATVEAKVIEPQVNIPRIRHTTPTKKRKKLTMQKTKQYSKRKYGKRN